MLENEVLNIESSSMVTTVILGREDYVRTRGAEAGLQIRNHLRMILSRISKSARLEIWNGRKIKRAMLGLNYMPPEKYTDILTLSTSESDYGCK